MIRQISITGRRRWKALKMFPMLPCPEALSSDQAANLFGGGDRTADYLALEYSGETGCPMPVWPDQQKKGCIADLQSQKVNRPHFQVPQGFRETAARTVK